MEYSAKTASTFQTCKHLHRLYSLAENLGSESESPLVNYGLIDQEKALAFLAS